MELTSLLVPIMSRFSPCVYKISHSWFYGFKLHLVVNGQGRLLAFYLTQDNVDDRRPMPKLIKGLFGDKGYLSKPLPEHLLVTDGIRLITKLRKQIRNRLFDLSNKHLLRKWAIIKAINDQLKNTCQIEHSWHRSPINFLVDLVAGLIGYCHLPKEPSLAQNEISSDRLNTASGRGSCLVSENRIKRRMGSYPPFLFEN